MAANRTASREPEPRPVPEKIVYVRSADDVVSGGVTFLPASPAGQRLAILWIHGWGTNFYNPGYVGVGRELAALGFPVITANTRMHDIANVEKYVRGTRIRGGGYWGVTSEDGRDIRAWMDFAEAQGFARVLLVGHSAGWSSVARYAAESQDSRIAGLVLASGRVRGGGGQGEQKLIEEAERLVHAGKGDELLRLPNSAFASYVSAATYLDIVKVPAEYEDFFGTLHDKPAVTRIGCPILAFFGTREREVGGPEDLDVLTSAVQRHTAGRVKVHTAMIDGADHEYTGHAGDVARVMADWVNTASIR